MKVKLWIHNRINALSVCQCHQLLPFSLSELDSDALSWSLLLTFGPFGPALGGEEKRRLCRRWRLLRLSRNAESKSCSLSSPPLTSSRQWPLDGELVTGLLAEFVCCGVDAMGESPDLRELTSPRSSRSFCSKSCLSLFLRSNSSFSFSSRWICWYSDSLDSLLESVAMMHFRGKKEEERNSLFLLQY